MNELKKITALEIKISALRLELIGLKDELNRLADKGIDQLEEAYLDLKIKMLAKKFELAQSRSEKKFLETKIQTGPAAA